MVREIHRFAHYLAQVCGLRLTTCAACLKLVRAFLLDRFAAGRIRISALKLADVIRFLKKYTQGWGASAKRDVGNSPRSSRPCMGNAPLR